MYDLLLLTELAATEGNCRPACAWLGFLRSAGTLAPEHNLPEAVRFFLPGLRVAARLLVGDLDVRVLAARA